MREIDKDFEDAGIAVRFIVMGTADEAARFCRQFGDATRCLEDTDKRTYKAMGFEDYNLLRLFSDSALAKRRKENRAAGFRQNWGATKLKNAAQLPGAAFVDADGIVRWLYRGKHPGDLPTMKAMLNAIVEKANR